MHDHLSYRVSLLPDKSGLEAWSTARLPFEPKGIMQDFRNEIRQGLLSIEADPRATLRATHSGSSNDHVDAENVLFYNVGTSTFRHLAGTTLIFEKDRAPSDPASGYPYYSKYEVVRDPSLSLYELDSELARFDTGEGLDLSDPTAVWLAVKRGHQETYRLNLDADYALLATIGGRAARKRNLANVIKTVFDGVIAAFACHTVGTTLRDIAEKLSVKTGAEVDEVIQHIRDEQNAVLATGLLAWPRASGIQWNPPDDRCVAGLLTRDENHQCALSGSLWSVRPITQAR